MFTVWALATIFYLNLNREQFNGTGYREVEKSRLFSAFNLIHLSPFETGFVVYVDSGFLV